MEHLLIFINYALFMLPIFLRHCQHSRWFTWDEIKAMVYLKGWARVLRHQAKYNTQAVLLDHGPVFKLATLHAFGPERLKKMDVELWWTEMFRLWALTLNTIVLLDAPDALLVQRINNRKQGHAVKGKSEREAYEFLGQYRNSYKHVLEKLTSYGNTAVLQFQTNKVSTEEIKHIIMCALKLC